VLDGSTHTVIVGPAGVAAAGAAPPSARTFS
jgi:hypothetical protein